MSTSKIEKLIEDIFDFVENSKSSFANPNKVTIHRDVLYDMLDELRMTTPEEIKKCQKVINNRNAIMDDARKKAAGVIEEAHKKAAVIVDDSEMVHQANAKAREIVDDANAEARRIIDEANTAAEQIRISAITYTNDLLTNAEGILQNAYKNTKARYDLVFEALKEDLDVIADNKKELERDLPKNVVNTAQAASKEEKAAAEGDMDTEIDNILSSGDIKNE